MRVEGELYVDMLMEKAVQKLAFDEKKDYFSWKKEVREKYIQLLGIDKCEQNSCPLNYRIEKETQKDGYTQYDIIYESEKGCFVPCYLLIPNTGKEKYPLAITLQGHAQEGARASIGETLENDGDSAKDYILGRGQFAVQAVKNGYAALAIEQRGMGIRRPKKNHRDGLGVCNYEAYMLLLLGRTILGGRVWDVSKAIDVIEKFPKIDKDKILITGNSGGGTASYYAGCFDERIKLVVPSCAFCTYGHSIIYTVHCSCNHIPDMYNWFDMQDVACLIAPRNLLIISGKNDGIFLIDGARKGFAEAKKMFKKEGVLENCQMVETEKAHWWCEDVVWDSINSQTKRMGW